MMGLYLVTGAPPREPALPAIGRLWGEARGPLASRADGADAVVLFEGVLTAGRVDGATDAEVALAAWRRGGVDALRRLDGFYQLALVEPELGRATLVCDPLATRPAFVHRGAGAAAVAPNPGWFVAAGLPTRLDRLGLYQTFRVNHAIGGRTLAAEVERNRPLAVYTLGPDGAVSVSGLERVVKRVDPSLDLERATDRLRDLTADVVDGILTHPRLTGLPIHLPLTAGQDSRHLLAELLRQGRPPASLVHVRLKDAELRPVEAMARGLALPLRAPDLAELDHPRLLRAWVARTAGSAHFHQLYLMGVAEALPPGGVVGFDGYLADKFLGLSQMSGSIRRRRYARLALRLLFPDHAALSRDTDDAIDAEVARFDGPAPFRLAGADAFNRGPGYTGSVFPILGDGALYFAPGAHRAALDFFCAAPADVAGDKRARLHLFRRDFPDLARYATEQGPPLSEMHAQTKRLDLRLRRFTSHPLSLLTLGRRDPAPGSEHAWLRQIPAFARVCARVCADSALARDGHLPARRVARMWPLHRAGAYLGWALMSLVTAEVAYRTQILGEPADAVGAWLAAP